MSNSKLVNSSNNNNCIVTWTVWKNINFIVCQKSVNIWHNIFYTLLWFLMTGDETFKPGKFITISNRTVVKFEFSRIFVWQPKRPEFIFSSSYTRRKNPVQSDLASVFPFFVSKYSNRVIKLRCNSCSVAGESRLDLIKCHHLRHTKKIPIRLTSFR